ncbi:M20 family metallopeptidase [Bordetella bronchiseptica]|uniref:M20 family metallopeptidase n=1 Tax=Bordetella bronchiseptica TaxID=518 RepID=UPI00045B06A0|nr:M20 family metallopeptidase [Bordetella bronchiseptica]KCV57104.1 peptidase dimerization domain protein [Bordetella bronchiseptica 7E71]KDD14144.1 peptidase dimerization domain protein [Bordetella bronchiseptica MBORD707]
MSKQAMLDAIEAEREVLIGFLQEFVRAASPNPPGDTRAAAAVIQGFLSARGVPNELLGPQESMPNVVSECEGGRAGPRLVYNGHMDVFPVGDGHGWTRDPWSGDIEEGRLHGRGTCDMKTGTAASVIAYAYLYARRAQLAGSVALTAVSDEETGGRWGTRWLLENDTRWRGDCVLNGEPSSLDTIRFSEKGTLRLKFEVLAAGAHGAYVHRSESPTRIAAALIGRLAEVEAIEPSLPAALKAHLQREDVRHALDVAMGEGAADVVTRTTLNVGVLNGGLKINMIPDRCVFEVDIRLPVGTEPDVVLARLEGILAEFPQASMEVQQWHSTPPNVCAHDHPMVDFIADNAQAIVGRRPVAVPSIGSTDCRYWRRSGVPAYVYGPAPGRMAMSNESVDLDEFIAVAKVHAAAGWDYLNGAA